MKTKHTRQELAEMAGVTTRTLQNWKAEGVNLDDTQAVLKRAADVVNKQDPEADDSLRKARLKKINLECRRIEMAIQRENSAFVPYEVAERSHKLAWTVLRSALRDLEGWLPGMLVGQSPAQMARQLKDAFHSIQERLRHERFWHEGTEAKQLQRLYADLDKKNLCHDCRQERKREGFQELIRASITEATPDGSEPDFCGRDLRADWIERAEELSEAWEVVQKEMEAHFAQAPPLRRV